MAGEKRQPCEKFQNGDSFGSALQPTDGMLMIRSMQAPSIYRFTVDDRRLALPELSNFFHAVHLLRTKL